MRFAWPAALLALLIPIGLVAYYVFGLRRRRRNAVLYSDVGLLRAAAPARPGWKRHLPIALVVAALAALSFAMARPQVRIELPGSSSAVVLAVDVSGSMCATDVDPNRLAAAQKAVRSFVQAQKKDTRIGLVVFAGFAQIAVPPTDDHGELFDAIDNLTIGRGTTIGAAILKSVDAIAQINPNVAPVASGDILKPGAPGAQGEISPDPTSDHVPEIIVLLTDGANTRGVTAQQAATIAAQRGVRVFPIGFGTANPTRLVCTAAQLGGMDFEAQGADSSQIRRDFLVVDEESLREVASVTGGTYYAAQNAGELQKVLTDLPQQRIVRERTIELSAALIGLALLLTVGAVAAAARWTAFPNR